MKRFILATLLLPLALGCKQVNAPLPAWAPNSQVVAAGYAIAAANGAVVQYEADKKAPGFVLNPTLDGVMSDMQQALNVGQPIFDTWEGAARTAAANASAAALKNGASASAATSAGQAAADGVAEPTTLPAQITRITSDLAKLPSTAGN